MAQHGSPLRHHAQPVATTLAMSCSLWFLPEKGFKRESIAGVTKLQRQRGRETAKLTSAPRVLEKSSRKASVCGDGLEPGWVAGAGNKDKTV